jgi:hypothetical protein
MMQAWYPHATKKPNEGLNRTRNHAGAHLVVLPKSLLAACLLVRLGPLLGIRKQV